MPFRSGLVLGLLLVSALGLSAADDWPQFMYDARHSGNAADHDIAPGELGLAGVAALSDGIYTSPVVAGGNVYVLDGSGLVWCLDADTLEVRWKFQSKGGPQNVNNVSSPAVAGDRLHFGTTSGYYYVLDRHTGKIVTEIDCRESIFSTPAVGRDRVYFATLGSRVFAVTYDGEQVWEWDFVKEVIGFQGNRWSGEDWVGFRGDRVTWKDHFVCSRDLCLVDKTVVIPAGGRTLFLEDTGGAPKLKATGEIPNFSGSEFPATFGQSADADGT
ncbi:MAG: PQQ-binding-like beta-propeller repeat protein, partial [Verrucomicrobiae bacterium]|nr:PQQ-binding-like beta-propeller repeat protein [Verrucomicrobiae bacterium]